MYQKKARELGFGKGMIKANISAPFDWVVLVAAFNPSNSAPNKITSYDC